MRLTLLIRIAIFAHLMAMTQQDDSDATYDLAKNALETELQNQAEASMNEPTEPKREAINKMIEKEDEKPLGNKEEMIHEYLKSALHETDQLANGVDENGNPVGKDALVYHALQGAYAALDHPDEQLRNKLSNSLLNVANRVSRADSPDANAIGGESDVLPSSQTFGGTNLMPLLALLNREPSPAPTAPPASTPDPEVIIKKMLKEEKQSRDLMKDALKDSLTGLLSDLHEPRKKKSDDEKDHVKQGVKEAIAETIAGLSEVKDKPKDAKLKPLIHDVLYEMVEKEKKKILTEATTPKVPTLMEYLRMKAKYEQQADQMNYEAAQAAGGLEATTPSVNNDEMKGALAEAMDKVVKEQTEEEGTAGAPAEAAKTEENPGKAKRQDPAAAPLAPADSKTKAHMLAQALEKKIGDVDKSVGDPADPQAQTAMKAAVTDPLQKTLAQGGAAGAGGAGDGKKEEQSRKMLQSALSDAMTKEIDKMEQSGAPGAAGKPNQPAGGEEKSKQLLQNSLSDAMRKEMSNGGQTGAEAQHRDILKEALVELLKKRVRSETQEAPKGKDEEKSKEVLQDALSKAMVKQMDKQNNDIAAAQASAAAPGPPLSEEEKKSRDVMADSLKGALEDMAAASDEQKAKETGADKTQAELVKVLSHVAELLAARSMGDANKKIGEDGAGAKGKAGQEEKADVVIQVGSKGDLQQSTDVPDTAGGAGGANGLKGNQFVAMMPVMPSQLNAPAPGAPAPPVVSTAPPVTTPAVPPVPTNLQAEGPAQEAEPNADDDATVDDYDSPSRQKPRDKTAKIEIVLISLTTVATGAALIGTLVALVVFLNHRNRQKMGPAFEDIP